MDRKPPPKKQAPPATVKRRLHALLAALLKQSLTPVDIEVRTEVQVVTEPPQADFILIRRKGDHWTQTQRLWLADGIRDSDAPEILIEFKATQSLNEAAFLQLLVYDHLYRTSNALKVTDLQSFLISAKTPNTGILQRLGFERTAQPGVYTSKVPLVSALQVILLNELSGQPHNATLKVFASRRKEQRKAFTALGRGYYRKAPQALIYLLNTLRRIIMGEATLSPDEYGWTPEALVKLGEKWMDTATKEKIRAEAQAETRHEDAVSFLLRLLEHKFGPQNEDLIDRINASDYSTLNGWLDRAMGARSLDEVFNR